MRAVQRFSRNFRGRDFVIGDIHGAFDLVLHAMSAVNFDPTVDRLFATGDLIDRGPGSHRCARFLHQPYTASTRGNHEDTLLELYGAGEPHPAVLEWQARNNGLGWWLTVTRAQREEILATIAEMPLAIEVETARGLVGIVHAEVPRGMSWPEFTARLEAGEPETIKSALWGRERFKSQDCSGVPGVGRLFVGHNPHWAGLRQYANVYAIDTGAVYRELGAKQAGCLTAAEITAGTQVLSAPRANETAVDVRRGAPAQPFSPLILLTGGT